MMDADARRSADKYGYNMADEVIYKHANEEHSHPVDFTDELSADTTISASSVVAAVDSGGTATTSVVGTVSQSGMVLTAIMQAGTDGEDYLFTFTGRGTTTSRDATKTVEMRVRNKTGII